MKASSLFPLLLICVAGMVFAKEKSQKPEVTASPEQAASQVLVKPKSMAPVKKVQKGPFKNFRDLTREALQRTGFFDTWQTSDHLYLAIPESRLGEHFLFASQLSRGIGVRGLVGGRMAEKEGNIVALERFGDKVYLLQKPVRFTASKGSPEELALQATFGDSVLESAPIASIKEPKPAKEGEPAEERTLMIDIQPWLVSDLSGVAERLRTIFAQNSGSPARFHHDRSRSYLTSTRAFPGNLNFKVKLTFRPGTPQILESVPDDRYIPLTVYHTFAALPEEPMAVREADPRMGFFTSVRKDFSKTGDPYTRAVRRWRLEPGTVEGGLAQPVKPITFYLGPDIPDAYRQTVKDGVLAWNKAFEAAGFRDAVKTEDLPGGIEPEDIRFPTIRWSTSDRSVYDAIGQTLSDPRTGEILDADILIEASLINKFGRAWRREQPMRFSQNAYGASFGDCHGEFLAEMSMQVNLATVYLASSGGLESGEKIPPHFIEEALKSVVMHEVGHALGLTHNFRSSSDTPMEKLHDRDWVSRNGLTSSVMDYPAINLAPKGRANGYYFTPVVGRGDLWTIAFGYTTNPQKAASLAREGAVRGFSYGTDIDAEGPAALDPHTNAWDLSSDPLAWAMERTDLIRGLWSRIPDVVLADNVAYEEVTLTFDNALNQYAQALTPILKYIGGQHVYRDHFGDPKGRAPFEAIPLERQRQALTFLARNVFSPEAFQTPSQVVSQFGGLKWQHWGRPDNFQGRQDYPFHEEVVALQNTLLLKLTHPLRLAAMKDGEYKFGEDRVLGIPELMESLTQSIWTEVQEGSYRNISGLRRDLQRAYLDLVLVMMTDTSVDLPADARSISRLQLKQLAAGIQKFLASSSDINTYTLAHLEEARARIDRALRGGER